MTRIAKPAAIALATAALSLGLAACGDDDGGGGGESGTLIHGTTDQPVSYDPAGSYDLPPTTSIFNVYQNLLQIPPGGNKPEPEAAESCDFTDDESTVYECTLKDGAQVLRRLGPHLRGRQGVVRAQPRDRRPAGRLVALSEPEVDRHARTTRRWSST